MITMTLELARRAVDAAMAEAKALGVPVSVSVVDESGRLVLCARGDGATFFSPDTSRAKAVAAAAFRAPTKAMSEIRDRAPAFWNGVVPVLGGELLPSTGAVPILKDGEVIGAIGCGGARDSEQDHQCAEAGAAAVGS